MAKTVRWHPIKSAPLDRRILVGWWDGEDWITLLACWDAQFDFEWDEEREEGAYKGAWTDNTVAHWGMEERNSCQPTHWRELPPPPPRRKRPA